MAAVAVLVVGTFAQAAIIGTSTLQKQPPGVPFAAPDAALPAPWVSYSLGLQATAGEVIAAVDVLINGQLHQRWADVDFDTIFDPSPNSPNATQGDSHLAAISGALFGAPAAEDNSGVGSPLASGTFQYGIGSFLSGAWGIPGPSQGPTASLAYIVIPEGSQVSTQIRVRVADQNGGIIGELGPLDFAGFGEPVIPEPTSLVLLGLALVGAAGFRRRK